MNLQSFCPIVTTLTTCSPSHCPQYKGEMFCSPPRQLWIISTNKSAPNDKSTRSYKIDTVCQNTFNGIFNNHQKWWKRWISLLALTYNWMLLSITGSPLGQLYMVDNSCPWHALLGASAWQLIMCIQRGPWIVSTTKEFQTLFPWGLEWAFHT